MSVTSSSFAKKISPAVLDRLARFDTATICNVIELFAVRPRCEGYLDGTIQAAFPDLPPMVGIAATAAFRSARAPGAGDAYGSLEDQLELFARLPGPAVVVFQDLDDPAVGATFGEVMCSTYQAFGSVGLITSGGGRDLAQVRALDYPVFIGSTICSHAYCHILHVGLPVRVGRCVIATGDLVHGDANGVTTIPLDIADEVADAAPEFVAAEQLVLEYVKSSAAKSIGQYRERRQGMSEAIAKLQARLSRRNQ